METLGIIGFVVALVLTPVYLLLFAKGVRSLSDIRNMFGRPPGDYGDRQLDEDERSRRDPLD
jgi:hypothetical protein